MAGRSSARMFANQDHALSPPKPSRDRRTESPVGRRTRSTRSQSIELGVGDAAVNTKRNGRRGTREGSVDSLGSVSSTGSKSGRKKKAPRKAGVASDLSMVVEDQEDRQPDDKDDAPEMDIDHQPGVSFTQRSQSPGAMSQISGTTAMTSESSKELAILDPVMVVDVLPELYQTAHQVLDLLAPPRPSLEMVQSIVKELQVPGSRKGKQLKHKEKIFEAAAENYTSDIDRTKFPFINISIIFRRLLGTSDPTPGNFRPDAVIYAANLAFLTKSVLVLHQEGDDALRDLQVLENAFPAAFLSGFRDEPELGNSALLEESFELGLELRTQILIAFLRHWRESPDNFDPDQILAGIFFDLPTRRSASFDFEDTLRNGALKPIGSGSMEALTSKEQTPAIMERVDLIRATFNRGDEAIADNDIVDFEQLDGAFPWSDFLTRVVQFSRSRLAEVDHNIRSQGGAQNIKKSLVQRLKDMDSQIDISYQSPADILGPQQSENQHPSLLPAADITPASVGKSLYTGKKSVILLQNLKSSTATRLPPSNQNQHSAFVGNDRSKAVKSSNLKTPSNKRHGPTESVTEPARITDEMRRLHDRREAVDDYELMDDEDIGELDTGNQVPSSILVGEWDKVNQDKNKENRPAVGETRQAENPKRFLDRQPNAIKIQFVEDSQESLPGPSNRKRARQESPESDTADDPFQEDQRPSPGRRQAAPVPRRNSPTPTPAAPSPKRVRMNNPRTDDEDDDDDAERPRGQGRRPADMYADAVVDEPDRPTPSMQDITASAKEARNTARARARVFASRGKVMWSEHDSQRLRYLIETLGCSWSLIQKQGGFQHERDQVALKDRARNMKVAYLKSGIIGDDLPTNFDQIPLGKKEMDAVRAVLGNVDNNGYLIDDSLVDD